MKKLPKPIVRIMIEMFRRMHVLHNGEVKSLCIPSTMSEMKQAKELKLVEAPGMEIPRTPCWYKFSERGLQVVELHKEAGLSADSFENFDIKCKELERKIYDIKVARY